MRKFVCFHTTNNRKEYIDYIEDFQVLQAYLTDRIFDYVEDEDGNDLPDDDCTLKNCNGDILVEGRAAIFSPTGVIEFDGNYDRYEVMAVASCSNEELEIIVKEYNNGHTVDDEILDAVCDRLEYTHVHGVTAYRNSIDVSRNDKSPMIGTYINRDEWEGCTRQDFTDYLRDDLQVLTRDIDKILTEVDIYDWFE